MSNENASTTIANNLVTNYFKCVPDKLHTQIIYDDTFHNFPIQLIVVIISINSYWLESIICLDSTCKSL